MANPTERNLAFGFALVGGVLMIAAAIVSAITAGIYASNGHGGVPALATASVVLFVLGGLVLLFAYLGQKTWRDRPIVTGVVLVVLAAVGWGVLGLGGNAIALVAAILTLVAGVLYLIEPATTIVRSTATS